MNKTHQKTKQKHSTMSDFYQKVIELFSFCNTTIYASSTFFMRSIIMQKDDIPKQCDYKWLMDNQLE